MIASSELKQCDEPILKQLKRIEATKAEDESKLTVVFHFNENDYFTNQTITKSFDIEGDEIKKSYGDKIEWKEGKNVTVKLIKKKNKNKKTGEKVVKTKEVKEESFFNFFNDIEINEDEDDEDEEENQDVELLEQQYELAQHLYEEIIPYSIEVFLGVNSLDGFEGFGGIEEEDEEDEEEEKEKPKKVGIKLFRKIRRRRRVQRVNLSRRASRRTRRNLREGLLGNKSANSNDYE